ncbi:MAG: hypothetical protein AB7I41_13100 [Candidatus Sericytochromatia bacterium]
MHKLEELEGLQSHLADQRHVIANQAYEAGMACLVQAQATGFSDPALLKQTCSHLLDAIRHQHHLPDPYIAMAYLMLLLDNRSAALHYLDEALRIEPGNPSAANLSQLIHSDSTPRQVGPHFERRFEVLLEKTIREISQTPPPEPCTDSDALSQLEAQAIELRRQYDELNDLALPHERSQLGLIAKRLENFEAALQKSCEWQELHESLLEEQAAAASLELLSDANAPLAGQELAQTLSHCDQLADEINALETAGVGVSELEADYGKLADTVEQVQAHLHEKGIDL